MAQIIQTRHDTAANWTSANPTLAIGECGYETNTGLMKFGDGTTAWNSLAYFTIPAASDTVSGKIEIATIAETNTGTDATRAVSPDGLAGSTIFGVKGISCQVIADATDVDSTVGIFYFRVPQAFNGMNLLRAQSYVITAGTTNATTVQVRNMTKYSSNDALSTAISIASGATIGTAGTVDANYDDVATDDLIKVYVTAQSTTKPKGWGFILEYQLP